MKQRADTPNPKTLLEFAGGKAAVLDLRFSIVAASAAYALAIKRLVGEIVGKSIFEFVPVRPVQTDATGSRLLKRSLEQVVADSAPHTVPHHKFEISGSETRGGRSELVYWSVFNFPILDSTGQLIYILHRIENLTERGRRSTVLLEQARIQRESNINAAQLKLEYSLRANQYIAANLRLAKATHDIGMLYEQMLVQADRSVWKKDEQLRTFIEYAPVALAMFDRQMRYLHASQRWVEDHDLSARGFIGHSHYLLCPHTPKRWKDAHRRGLAGQVVHIEEDQVRRTDGTVQWLRWVVRPWRDDAGAVGGVLIFAEDITERKRAVEALHEREERLRGILDTVMDAVITTDRNGRIVGLNKATERILGYDEADLLDRNVRMLLPSFDDEPGAHANRRMHRSFASKMMGQIREMQGRRKDASILPVELAVTEVTHLSLLTWVIRDISQRRQLEEQVLQISEDERQRVAADLHDGICQELVGISFVATGVQRDLEGANPKLAKKVRGLSQAVAQVAGDVRGVARGMNPVVADKNGLVLVLRQLAANTAQTHRIRCLFECPSPVVIHDVVVANQLYRIAQEAIQNAIRHAKATRVVIALRKKKQGVYLSIRDNGCGLKESSSKGMGFRTMRYRATLIGGHLSLNQRPGGGTEVCCQLPGKSSR